MSLVVLFTNILLQAGLLSVLLLAFRQRNVAFSSASNLFQPMYWFVLWFVVNFLITQTLLPWNGFELLGLERYSAPTLLRAALKTQFALTGFLVAFIFGAATTGLTQKIKYGSLALPNLKLEAARGHIFRIMPVLLVIGFGAFLFLFNSFVGGPRSALVKNLPGQLAYAASFAFSYAGAIYACRLILKRHYLDAVLILLLLGGALLQLGGRARVLWPIVHIVLFLALFYKVKLQLPKMLMFSALLFILLQSLDPIFLFVQGEPFQSAAARFLEALDVSKLFTERTFDAFHNLATLLYLNRIDPSPHALIQGNTGTLFMRTYFLDVWEKGVGFPLPLPGELWIGFRWAGLLCGAYLFGTLMGFLNAFYWSLTRQSALWLYLIVVTAVSNVGAPYFDQFLKVTASILPPLFIWLLDHVEFVNTANSQLNFGPNERRQHQNDAT